MGEPIESSPAVLDALRHPPSCLVAFAHMARPGDLPIFVDFELRCRACGSETFQVSSFPEVVPDPSPYFGRAPGEILQRSPHILQCVGCGGRGVVFDPCKHGYDAVLNNYSAYECGNEGELTAPGQYKVRALFAYNNDFDENQAIAEEKGVQPSDLFDAFCLICEPSGDDGSLIEFEYECA